MADEGCKERIRTIRVISQPLEKIWILGEEPTMKLVSWNVNGIRACVNKGFLDYFKEVDADIFCLQETKVQAGQIELDLV